MTEKPDQPPTEAAHPDWFRPPTRKEQGMGAALFLGFGVFFIFMYWVWRDSAFKWVILGLAVISFARGLWHGSMAMRRTRE
jgi:hypothetical protein